MAKNAKRKRSFKVHSDFNGNPFIRFGGKYLTRELGLAYGDRLEIQRDGNMIMLRKYSMAEIAEYETTRQENALLKKLLALRPKRQMPSTMMVAENQETYSIDDELIRLHEKLLQDLKN